MPLEEPGRPELHRITDARTLRALAHPVRIALIEELSVGGPMTATEVGEIIGESPTTCSFHLRQLAKYGLVEEAGGGRGRARPWRMSTIGLSISGTRGDTESQVAAAVLGRMFRDRSLRRFQTWRDTRNTYPQEWQDASDDSSYLFYVTAEELEQLNQELSGFLMSRHWDRLTDPSRRPPGAVPVEMVVVSYPVNPPSDSSGGTDAEGT
ncbi:MAG TPA: helix-turn-helix domain-containing protein [Pseudonocardiaceae bacterium]|nr:helix-turn-helix domain-containing protein [Pseudonocardiaceae bacterium]